MSKQRQVARAQREAAAAERAARDRADRQRAAAVRARREARALTWRRLRIWQHDGRDRTRQRWGVLAIIVLIVLLVVFVLTRSWPAVVGAALVCVIAAPVYLVLERSRS